MYYIVSDEELISIAGKIRAKKSESTQYEFPVGFVNAIDTLTDTHDANATSADILNGKTSYVNGVKITGNIQSKAAETLPVSTVDRTIDAAQYLSGDQTIRGVVVGNVSAGNIKAGVNVKIGDSDNAGRIKDVTGTFTSDANAAADNIEYGKTAYVNGEKITGRFYISNVEVLTNKYFGMTGSLSQQTTTFYPQGQGEGKLARAINIANNHVWRIKDILSFSVFGVEQDANDFVFVPVTSATGSIVHVFSNTGSNITVQRPSGSTDPMLSISCNVYDIVVHDT